MGLDTGSTQSLQRGDVIGRARCSSDADNQTRGRHSLPPIVCDNASPPRTDQAVMRRSKKSKISLRRNLRRNRKPRRITDLAREISMAGT